jgi:hypothetical protein
MVIKNFRKGLLGQFTYFGVIPSAVVVLSIIGISAYLSARTTKRESASFATSEASGSPMKSKVGSRRLSVL